MSRLPIPGSDAGTWGQILNDFLAQTHNVDGTLSAGAVGTSALADASVTQSKISATGGANGQVLSTDGTNFTWVTVSGSGSVPDATTSTKGLVQLAGDLAGTAAAPTVPGLAGKEPTITAGTTSQYYRGDKSWQTLDKTAIGLGNVDNTSDVNKPVSTATQTALNSKAPLASPTFSGTVTVPTPTNNTDAATKAYVDSAAAAGTPDATTLVKGKIQLAGDLAGTAAAPTVPGLAGKEPTITAGTTSQYYRGDKSWQTLDKTAVGLANVDNTSDVNKPVSTATQTALNAKAPLASPTFTGTVTVPAPTNGTDAATKTYVDASATPDATTLVKGKVQLAGDLGGTAASPTVPGLASKANTTTTISAGTGLTGGGDLSANRTLTVSYGTIAGTAAQGNDSRITGAEQTANKGVANGYASLNSSTRVPTGQLGSGTADNTTYLRGDGSWTTTPSAPVTSVAGKTGVVTLVESDVASLTGDLAARTTVSNGGGETYFDAGNSGATITLDLANGNVQKLTLTANCTITLTSPASGAFRSLLLYVFQDATGSRTITWPGTVKWGTAGAPTLSTAATKMDKVLLDTVDGGTTWYGMVGPGGF